MKYAISLMVGFIIGVMLFFAAFYYNPFVGRQRLSPLAISDGNQRSLSYSAVTSKTILFTNDGESISKPSPPKVAELWEPAIQQTQLMLTSLIDSRGSPVGIGIKVASPSEKTRLAASKILVDSAWHIYLPGHGTLAIYQIEDYWSYLRDIVIPAWRSSSESWRGAWSSVMTIGPNALGTAQVVGLGGKFDGMQSEAVESLNARAYSVLQGPVSMTGTLSIALTDESAIVGEAD